MDTLFIIMPAYNESANIRQTVENWYPIVEAHDGGGTSRLVVLNDGSTDNTLEVLQELESSRELMTVISKPNSGHGPTLIRGYHYALDSGADYIFQTDSDGQTDPADFDRFWRRRMSYDALFGNRTNRADGRSRKFVEKTLCRMLKHYFGVSVPDANAPYRLMRADYVRSLLPLFPEDYFLPNVMLTALGVYYGKNIRFLPVYFRKRQGGTDSVNVGKIARIGFDSLADFRKIRKALPPQTIN
ncbi:MAG: glycosyltransferase family 2 protein [Eubacteriales bacterium]|jgi:glycosyltransferase involved in cell wall biosynthesis